VLVGYFLFRAARQIEGTRVQVEGEPRAVRVR
jgi:hypothetical protein